MKDGFFDGGERLEPDESGCSRDKLTGRQRQVLDFIGSTVKQLGFPPTVRDIAAHLNIISLNAVRRHLQALEKKGCIQVERGKSRGIRVEDSADAAIPAVFRVPLVGRVAAGPLSTAVEDVEGFMAIDPDFWGDPVDLFFLRVKGDSMTPRLEEGDLVLVRSQSHGDPGDVVVALSGEEATVKQLLVKNGKFILHPLNGAYKDIKPDEGFAINGKVVGLIRRI